MVWKFVTERDPRQGGCSMQGPRWDRRIVSRSSLPAILRGGGAGLVEENYWMMWPGWRYPDVIHVTRRLELMWATWLRRRDQSDLTRLLPRRDKCWRYQAWSPLFLRRILSSCRISTTDDGTDLHCVFIIDRTTWKDAGMLDSNLAHRSCSTDQWHNHHRFVTSPSWMTSAVNVCVYA